MTILMALWIKIGIGFVAAVFIFLFLGMIAEQKHMGNALQISSNKGSVILDLFGGSGSTMIACEQLNRKCYMMELDPHYVSVILSRYIKFKGSDADVFLLKDGNKIPYNEVSNGND